MAYDITVYIIGSGIVGSVKEIVVRGDDVDEVITTVAKLQDELTDLSEEK